MNDVRVPDETIPEDEDLIPEAPTLRDRMMDFLGLKPDLSRRLYALTHAIAVAPDAAVNYVLRGELYLERSQFTRAAEDFEVALEIAEREMRQDTRSLGVLAQSIQDRALTGYETAIRRVENQYKQPKRKVE